MILPPNPFPFSRVLLPRVREPQMCTKPLLKHLQIPGLQDLSPCRSFAFFLLGNGLTENQCQSVNRSVVPLGCWCDPPQGGAVFIPEFV